MKKFILGIWDKIDDFVLEAGRIALIGAYSGLLPFVLERLDVLSKSDAGTAALIILVILKSFDRWLHSKGVLEKGITGF